MDVTNLISDCNIIKMRIHLTHDDLSNSDYGRWFCDFILSNSQHQIEYLYEEDPHKSDIILIISRGDKYYSWLRYHPLVYKYSGKCYIYDTRDNPIDVLPGLYTSMPRRRYCDRRHRSAGYIAPINDEVSQIAQIPREPDLLCSFVGGPTSHVRKKLFNNNPFRSRSDVIIRNSYGWPARDQRDVHMFREYAEILVRSRFVLCPRGIGTCTYRLFETMEVGRVPVILSDEWVPPVGPDWDNFSLRVAEEDWWRLPEILETYHHRSHEMGKAARKAWELWFAPQVLFMRIGGWLEELVRANPGGGRIRPVYVMFQVTKNKVVDKTKSYIKRLIGRN